MNSDIYLCYYLMVWFVFFATMCSVIFFFTRESYIGELASSFLPYMVGGWLLLAIVSLVVVLASKKRWAKFLSGCSFVVFVVMIGW